MWNLSSRIDLDLYFHNNNIILPYIDDDNATRDDHNMT